MAALHARRERWSICTPSVLRHDILERRHYISTTLFNLRLHADTKQEGIQVVFSKR
jgi:hypothetical protein